LGNPDHDESIRIIHAALDAGINFVDTADVYGQGESEEIVAKALAGGRRDDVILATKFHGAMGDDPNRQGSSRRWIIRAVEDSLRRLRTDWIDLYQVHRPAEHAGITLIQLAIAFVLNHPAITAAIIGPRTMEQFEAQFAAADVVLDDAVLDRIDEIVPPGVTVNPVDNSFDNPALHAAARRR
jgi:aryl-alcohol dehydrogenase-like predicted oxidoreductase